MLTTYDAANPATAPAPLILGINNPMTNKPARPLVRIPMTFWNSINSDLMSIVAINSAKAIAAVPEMNDAHLATLNAAAWSLRINRQ